MSHPLNDIIDFCKKNGSKVNEHLFETSIENGLRGIVATQDLAEDSLLFKHTYPLDTTENLFSSLILSLDTVKKNTLNMLKNYHDSNNILKIKLEIINEFEPLVETDELKGFSGTCFALFVEFIFLKYCDDVKSTTNLTNNPDYLKWLPDVWTNKDLSSVMCWNTQNLEFIANTSLSSDLNQFKNFSRKSFFELYTEDNLPKLYQFLKKHFSSEFDKELLWDVYNRCASIVQSYSFTIPVDEEEKIEIDEEDSETFSHLNLMIPLMDAFNADEARNNVRLFSSFDNSSIILEARTISVIKKGEQLYNCFGEMTANERMLKYGYIDASDDWSLTLSGEDICVGIFQKESQDFSPDESLDLSAGDLSFLEQCMKENRVQDFFEDNENETIDYFKIIVDIHAAPAKRKTTDCKYTNLLHFLLLLLQHRHKIVSVKLANLESNESSNQNEELYVAREICKTELKGLDAFISLLVNR